MSDGGLQGRWLEGLSFPLITPEGDYYPEVAFDEENGSLMGQYWNAVGLAMDDRDRYEDRLSEFEDVVVADLLGNQHRLLASLDALIEFHAQMDAQERKQFEREFYRPHVRVRG